MDSGTVLVHGHVLVNEQFVHCTEYVIVNHCSGICENNLYNELYRSASQP